MSDYRENLTAEDVTGVFAELGLDFHLDKDELFRVYEGRKWTRMRHEEFPVILNVLPGDAAPGEPFWEEWYLQDGKVHHHILTLTEPESYDEIFTAPESDDIHPPETFGQTWYVVDWTDMTPVLTAGKQGEAGPVVREILYSYSTILRAKIRNFLKKSLSRYLLGAFLYSVGLVVVRGGTLFSPGSVLIFINFSLIIISLSFILMMISSGIMARKYQDWRMVYTFSGDGIHILNRMNGLDESHGWDWIQSYELTDKTLFLKIRSVKPFEIMLDRDKMTSGEVESILGWLDRQD